MNNIPKCNQCYETRRRKDNTNGLYYFDHRVLGLNINVNEQVSAMTALMVFKNNAQNLFNAYFADLSTDLEIADPYYILEGGYDNCQLNSITAIVNNTYPFIYSLETLREISSLPTLTIEQVISATQAAIYYFTNRPFTLDSDNDPNVLSFYEFLLDIASCPCLKDEIVVTLDRSMVKMQIEGTNTIVGPFYLRSSSLVARQHGFTYTINDQIIVGDSQYNKLLNLFIDQPFYCIFSCCDTITTLNLVIDDSLICGYNPLVLSSKTCGKPNLFLLSPQYKKIHIHLHYDLFRIMLVNNDGVNNLPLGNATFGLFNTRGQLVERLETDSYGVALSNILIDGVYTIKSLHDLPGYIPLSPITIDPPLGQADFIKKVLIKNYRYSDGRIILYDYDMSSHDPLRLGVFQLLDERGNVLVEKTTDNEGMTYFDNLLPGKYLLRQVVAPKGYNLNPKMITIILDDEQRYREARCENRRSSGCCFGKLTICKYDRCQETIHLQATFGIYKNDQLIRTVTTNQEGRVETMLLADTYQVRELVAPFGYEIDTKSRKVDLKCYCSVHLDIPNRRLPA